MTANLKISARAPFAAGLIAVAAMALPFMASSAHAATAADSDTPRVEVHYGDLNLDTPKGRAKLAQRLSGAADEVCTVETTRIDYIRCRDAAITRARLELAARAANNHFAAR